MKYVELAKIKEVLSHTDGNQQLTRLVGFHSMLVFSDVLIALMHCISAGIQPIKNK